MKFIEDILDNKTYLESFYIILILIILTDLSTILNMIYFRQIMGSIFLTFIPGYLIIHILGLDRLEIFKRFILSIGLSISFIMIVGLIINNLLLSIGYDTPLTTISILSSFNILFILMDILELRLNGRHKIFSNNFAMTRSEKGFIIIPIFFIPLSILGIYILNISNNNTLIIIFLIILLLYVVLACILNKKFPIKLYPLVIFLISVSLLSLLSMRSNYIVGSDIHEEYYLFQITLDQLYWKAIGNTALSACLSISILPAIYVSILNIAPQLLYKMLFSLIFSICPLVVYIISKKYVDETYAFLASFFFMSQLNFIWTEYNPRTNVAILFYALSLMICFDSKINNAQKRVLLIIFVISAIVSHYSTAYIFFIVLLFDFIGSKIISKKYSFKNIISFYSLMIFLALIFLWYAQVTKGGFDAGVHFIYTSFISLNEFFLIESRGGGIQAMVGADIAQKQIPHKIQFISTWILFSLIGLGMLDLLWNYKYMSFPGLIKDKMIFLKEKFEVEFFLIAIINTCLLIATVLVPKIAIGYSLDRVFGMATVILSLFFIIGAIKLSDGLHISAYFIILLILIPNFLSITGLTYQAFDNPRSIYLNSKGQQYDTMYIHDQENSCSKWLEYHAKENIKVFGDFFGNARLRSQGMIRSPIYARSLIELGVYNESGYLFLSYFDIKEQKMFDQYSGVHNLNNSLFSNNFKIYENGGSTVWVRK